MNNSFDNIGKNIDGIIGKNIDGIIGKNIDGSYIWSDNTQEKITQLFYQLTRTNNTIYIGQMAHIFKELLESMSLEPTSMLNDFSNLALLLKLVAQTRDIVSGKGEYLLSYALLYELANFNFDYYKRTFEYFVGFQCPIEPYGSWKDVKYFLHFIDKNTRYPGLNLQIFQHCKTIVKLQLKRDYVNMKCSRPISLLGKWIPREHSKFGYLFPLFAMDYYDKWIDKDIRDNQQTHISKLHDKRRIRDNLPNKILFHPSVLKAKTHYRIMLSTINKYLDTVQVKQCANQWSNIDYTTVTTRTMWKQKFAFSNTSVLGNVRSLHEERIYGKLHFSQFLENCIKNKDCVKTRKQLMHIYPCEFVKGAIRCLQHSGSIVSQITGNNENVRKIIDQMWENSSSSTCNLGNVIPFVDLSIGIELEDGCANTNSFYNAIGLGIRVAEKSVFGKRILCFSNKAYWISLDDCDGFCSMVDKIITTCKNSIGTESNVLDAIDYVVDSMVEENMDREIIENMTFVLFSNMKFGTQYLVSDFDNNNTHHDVDLTKTLHDKIMGIFSNISQNNSGRYTPKLYHPHIVYWNMQRNNEFPCLSYENNISMFGGNSFSLLNQLPVKIGLHSTQQSFGGYDPVNPWTKLKRVLNQHRYHMLVLDILHCT